MITITIPDRRLVEKVTWAVVVTAAVAIGPGPGCAVVEPTPIQVKKPPDRDKAAQIFITCDQLGFHRPGDGHRLCVMRGIDRYVDHQTRPLSERYAVVPECGQWPCR